MSVCGALLMSESPCLCFDSPTLSRIPFSSVQAVSLFCLPLTDSPPTCIPTLPLSIFWYMSQLHRHTKSTYKSLISATRDMCFSVFSVLETWLYIRATMSKLWSVLCRYRKSHLCECVLITFLYTHSLYNVLFCSPVWLLVLFSAWLLIQSLCSSRYMYRYKEIPLAEEIIRSSSVKWWNSVQNCSVGKTHFVLPKLSLYMSSLWWMREGCLVRRTNKAVCSPASGAACCFQHFSSLLMLTY